MGDAQIVRLPSTEAASERDADAGGSGRSRVQREAWRGVEAVTIIDGGTTTARRSARGRGSLCASSSSRQWRLVRISVVGAMSSHGDVVGGAGTCSHTDKVLMVVEQWWSAMDKQAVDGG